jgi:hypothetical protein
MKREAARKRWLILKEQLRITWTFSRTITTHAALATMWHLIHDATIEYRYNYLFSHINLCLELTLMDGFFFKMPK